MTRMCTDREDMLQAYAWFLAMTPTAALPQESHKWVQLPGGPNTLNSCPCWFKMDSSPFPPNPPPAPKTERLCHQHREIVGRNLVNRRNEVDTWLRNAKKLAGCGSVVKATDRELRDRAMDGTYRACPCGKDVISWKSVANTTTAVAAAMVACTNAPGPRVLFCMGCEGYTSIQMHLLPWVTYPAAPPHVMLSEEFKKKWSRWKRSLPRIGRSLASR